MRLAPGRLDPHIKCGAGRLRRRPLDGRTSRQGGQAPGRHRGAGLVRRRAGTDRQVPRSSPRLQEEQHHHPHRRDGRLHEGRSGNLRRRDWSQEARRGPHALPAREHLGLRTEGKRTSGRAVSYVLFTFDEADFAARLSRPDVTVAITRLASKVPSWNTSHIAPSRGSCNTWPRSLTSASTARSSRTTSPTRSW